MNYIVKAADLPPQMDSLDLVLDKIVEGDCLDLMRRMPDRCVDLVVTDPPYGVEYDGGTLMRERIIGDASTAIYKPALSELQRLCSQCAAMYLFYADGDAATLQAVAEAGFTIRNNLIWNKHQAQFGALSAQYKQKHEPFLYCHLKRQSPLWFGPTNEVTVWDYARSRENEYHPTEKPTALFQRAIRNSSALGAVVFDPFLGSGTTAVAAKKLGRHFIGCEINPDYCKIAEQRLLELDAQPELFDSQPTAAVQRPLLERGHA